MPAGTAIMKDDKETEEQDKQNRVKIEEGNEIREQVMLYQCKYPC